jgi:phospholipid-translocating ATPase
MIDGIYQSVICFFMAYLLFRPATFVTSSGQDVSDRERLGIYVGPAAIVVVNTYILLNTYRWDWLMILLVTVSVLLVWFWTGVYSAFTTSEYFYKAAPQVFGQATFWATLFLSIVISLLPRFFIKSMQKVYFPYDVDIIREQVRQGKFKHLEGASDSILKSNSSSTASSDMAKPSKHFRDPNDDRRPIYPPSVAPTATTHNPRSATGSDGTDFTRHRESLEPVPRQSFERSRPSFDRMRASMDRIRPSYEATNDFTSAALLTRLESSNSAAYHHNRSNDISEEM